MLRSLDHSLRSNACWSTNGAIAERERSRRVRTSPGCGTVAAEEAIERRGCDAFAERGRRSARRPRARRPATRAAPRSDNRTAKRSTHRSAGAGSPSDVHAARRDSADRRWCASRSHDELALAQQSAGRRVNPGNRNQRLQRASRMGRRQRVQRRRPRAPPTGTRESPTPAAASRVPSRRDSGPGSPQPNISTTRSGTAMSASCGIARERTNANAFEALIGAIGVDTGRDRREARDVVDPERDVALRAHGRAGATAEARRPRRRSCRRRGRKRRTVAGRGHRDRIIAPVARRRRARCAGIIAAMSEANEPLTVDIVSDVVCPWCFIGKRHLEAALAELPGIGDVVVRWHPYELNPDLPSEGDRTQALPRSEVRRTRARGADLRARARGRRSAPASRSTSTRSFGSRTRAKRTG